MFILSPLEQFTTFTLIKWSNMSIINISIIIIIIMLIYFNEFLLQNHIGWWYTEINKGGLLSNHLFIIITIWLFIVISNLLGMIPFTSTLTAQFIVVLSISLPLFIGINILGFYLHGINLFYLILPSGVPILLTPFIAILEFIAYFIRVISLTLRLSANMVAGHILMKIFISGFYIFPIFSIVLLPILLLEFLIAILQGYVFVTLILSYYQDILLPH
jgi:ATP synthase subunit 6